MTTEEKELWQKAYAAAFANEFYRALALYQSIDRTVKSTSAELAATVADLAVIRLRQWRETEDPKMGLEINISEEWL